MLSLVLVCMLPMAMNEATEMGQKTLPPDPGLYWAVKKVVSARVSIYNDDDKIYGRQGIFYGKNGWSYWLQPVS